MATCLLVGSETPICRVGRRPTRTSESFKVAVIDLIWQKVQGQTTIPGFFARSHNGVPESAFGRVALVSKGMRAGLASAERRLDAGMVRFGRLHAVSLPIVIGQRCGESTVMGGGGTTEP